MIKRNNIKCGETLFVRLRRYENLAAGGKLINKYHQLKVLDDIDMEDL